MLTATGRSGKTCVDRPSDKRRDDKIAGMSDTGRMDDAAPEMSDPEDLALWALHCYCPNAKRTPHQVVSDGNNGRILYAARHGALRSHLDISDAQLSQLLEFGLLERDGEKLRTAFPVLGVREMTPLRAALRRLATPLVDAVEKPTRDIAAELRHRGLRHSLYAMVFGYALDLLLWQQLRAEAAVPDTTLTAERPWWNGAFWAIHPPRAGSSGTNFYRLDEDLTLVAVWSEATLRRLDDLATTPGMAESLRDRHTTVVTDPEGHLWRVRLDDGRSAIPLVGVGDALDDLASALAAPVSAFLLSRACQEAHRYVSTDDRTVATVIISHELIWEITEQLIARGTCTRAPQGDDLTGLLLLLANRGS
ncbi:hypothetical protein [Nonomuraea sp. NPDC049695]|uniref:hypothetical protein n=1 Tax=Nonomuraea sp. NPDC049695 TaxID=3154734 RepID=UPI00343AF474